MIKPHLLSLLLLLLPLTAAAQELSIDECRQMALQQNRLVKEARLQTLSTQYTARSARANLFPSLGLQAMGFYSPADGALLPSLGLSYEVGPVFHAGVSLQQPLYMGGRILTSLDMAREGQAMASQSLRMTERDVAQQTEEAYAQVVLAQEMVQVAQSAIDVLDEVERNVQSSLRQGMCLRSDLLTVQVRQSECQLQLQKARNALRLSRMSLCHLIGLPLLTEVQVADEYPQVSADLAAADVQRRPESLILQAQERQAGREVSLVRSEMRPQLSLALTYGYNHGLKLADKTLLDDAQFAGLLNLSIPLYHFGERTNRLKAAKARQRIAELDTQEQTELMELQLAQAIIRLSEAQLEVDISLKTIDQAKENLRIQKLTHREGTTTLSDLLDAQTKLQQAQTTHAQACYDLYLAHTAYNKAAGLE